MFRPLCVVLFSGKVQKPEATAIYMQATQE